jgi:hypothetical protein
MGDRDRSVGARAVLSLPFRDHFSPHGAMAWVSQLARRGRFFDLALGVRPFGSHPRHLLDIFSSNTAEYVAAAGSVSSIPRSMRLPEVAKTPQCDSHSMRTV